MSWQGKAASHEYPGMRRIFGRKPWSVYHNVSAVLKVSGWFLLVKGYLMRKRDGQVLTRDHRHKPPNPTVVVSSETQRIGQQSRDLEVVRRDEAAFAPIDQSGLEVGHGGTIGDPAGICNRNYSRSSSPSSALCVASGSGSGLLSIPIPIPIPFPARQRPTFRRCAAS